MASNHWTKWLAIAEILSAIAIAITLLYLASQTRELSLQTEQNNLLMRSQARSDISNTIANTLLGLAQSDYLEEIRPYDVERAGGLAAFRRLQFELANLPIWENIHYQWRNGLYEDSEFEAEKQVWRNGINRPDRRAVFCEYKNVLSPAFRAELEGLLEEPCE